MTPRRSAAILVVLVAASTLGPAAARAAAFGRGTLEFTPSLGFSHASLSFGGTDAGSTTTLDVLGLVGYGVTDRVELTGGLLLDHRAVSAPGSSSESATAIGATAGLQLNLAGRGRVIPFFRGAVGVATHSGDLSPGTQTTLIAPIVAAGIRLMVGASASVNVGVGYRHESTALGVSDLSGNTLEAEVGVSIIARHGR
ncbi:MAG: hypothetical protein E6K81_06560 [Candidatus Eisenbacteria bacterium]|uniref:Outer membrane protein beta-barrel domain-containing protein n=1 Tax=Eiseniibacteriota bacterium TaxID=2212470 RepID=A0A538UA35_UNCEI|nr:MAG: hypothetical protein E6K81_06560 [Candidatus Eisenbacteria bacterium]